MMIDLTKFNIFTSRLVKGFKNYFLTAVIFGSIIFGSIFNNLANAANNDKFAVVNIQKINEFCKVYKDIRGQMEAQAKKLQDEFEAEAKEIRQIELNLSKKLKVSKADNISPELRKEIENLNLKKQKIQQEINFKRQQLEKPYIDAISVVNKEVFDVVSKFGEKEGLSSILEASNLVYHKLPDVTDKIAEEIDKKIASYHIDFTKPSAKSNEMDKG